MTKRKSRQTVASPPQVTISKWMTSNSLMHSNSNTSSQARRTLLGTQAMLVASRWATPTLVSFKPSTSTKRSTICMSAKAWSLD